MTKGNVCGVLDRLETSGWVERRPDSLDRRANRLYLTTEGRAKVAIMIREHDALLTQLTRSLSDSDMKIMRSLFEKLESSLDQG